MKAILLLVLVSISLVVYSQNVGIGTVTPSARLHVADSSVVFTATGDVPITPGNTPISNAGRRMMWYPDKAAFRAGYIDGTQWNNTSIGKYSVGMGKNVLASGLSSVAFGSSTTASGDYSFASGVNTSAGGLSAVAMGGSNNASNTFAVALGNLTSAIGEYSTAFGKSTTASGLQSTAMGLNSVASGTNSIAIGVFNQATGSISMALGHSTNALADHATSMGYLTTASGANSTAMGYSTQASGNYSTAMGYLTHATGSYSTAMGSYVSTNGQAGALIIGDFSTTTTLDCFSPNVFRARFANGYGFFSNAAATVGVQVAAGGNSWVVISDVRMKENFEPVNGEEFLKKISRMPLTTWNYKCQDVKTFRHYGPMAQDFYKAFGHDRLGEIGCDTLINQQDFLGVSFIAIQALEKRTEVLQQKMTDYEIQIENLQLQNKTFLKKITDLATQVEVLNLKVKSKRNQ
ncbi:MAG TPA: tail fiber domain-containing protein [Ferruginibacter sp.]|nr:tail fiber domain-containing protein [Ferruginibacter sp.]